MEKNPSDSGLVSPSEAIQAIERLSDVQNEKEAIQTLSGILREGSDLVARSIAAELLVNYKGKEVATKVLSEILGSSSEGSLVRCAVARALGKIGGDEARNALVKSIEEDEEYPLVVVNSVKALGELGDPQAIPSITKLFSSMDDPRCPPYLIRTFAAETLGQIGALEAITALKKVLGADSHSSVREAAEKALENIAKQNDFSSIQELLESVQE
ncbi:MAG: HEAT repeat domain-containing protein [Candidatus Hodarchaeota archaeon]